MIALRYLIAAMLGLGLYAWSFHPWLPYSARERSQHSGDFLVVLFVALTAGIVLAWGARPHRFGIAAAFLGAMCAANAVVIGADWRIDPTDHNLFPFEFLMLALLSLPAFLGAALGGWLGSGVHKKSGAEAPPPFSQE